MTSTSIVVAEQNPFNGTWEVGWKGEDGEFKSYLCGYRTREEAEAEIPGFDERLKRDGEEFSQEKDAEECWQNERWPNLGYVRAKIEKLRDSGKAGDWAKSFDAHSKLDWLLAHDFHEHVSWPLPSWAAIKSGRWYYR